MKVSLNTYNNNSNLKNNYNNKNVSFRAIADIPQQSALLNPAKSLGNKVTDFIAKYYTAKLYESPIAEFVAKKAKNFKESPAGVMQIIGSTVISGMYMEQTLTNKKLEKKKRQTLAINQGLTFLVSTLMTLFVDSLLDKKWENLTRKYTAKMRNMTVEDLNKEIEEFNKTKKQAFDKLKIEDGLPADAKFTPKNVSDYIRSLKKEKPELNLLSKRLKGMGTLKKLLVFGTIYRYISPVAVTPIANMIGNKYIYKEGNPQKTEQKA